MLQLSTRWCQLLIFDNCGHFNLTLLRWFCVPNITWFWWWCRHIYNLSIFSTYGSQIFLKLIWVLFIELLNIFFEICYKKINIFIFLFRILAPTCSRYCFTVNICWLASKSKKYLVYTAACSFFLTASYFAHQCYLGIIRNMGVYLMGYPVHTNMYYHAWYLVHPNR